MHTREQFKGFLFGAAVVAALWGWFGGPGQHLAHATGNNAAEKGLMAVTGPENATLFLIDPTNQFVSAYEHKNQGLRMKGGRYVKYDLQHFESTGTIDGKSSIKEAGRTYEKLMEIQKKQEDRQDR